MSDVKITDLDNGVSSEDEVEVDALEYNVYDFASKILSGEWKNDLPMVDAFRDFHTAVSTLRAKLDAQIWDEQDNGRCVDVVSIRTRRSADAKTPGRKAQPKSLRDQLLRK